MLVFSIVLNLGFAVGLFVVLARAKAKILEEKHATFAGCLAAMTSGLATEDNDTRFHRVAFDLSRLCGQSEDIDATTGFLLRRASLFRLIRQPCVADLGEHVRLLALQISGRSNQKGDDLCDYIASPKRDGSGKTIEPGDHFGEEFLIAAQFEAEGQLLDYYRSQTARMPTKVFG